MKSSASWSNAVNLCPPKRPPAVKGLPGNSTNSYSRMRYAACCWVLGMKIKCALLVQSCNDAKLFCHPPLLLLGTISSHRGTSHHSVACTEVG